MKLIGNSGNGRVVDALRESLPGAGRLDVASPEFSLFAFAEIRDLVEGLAKCRMILPTVENGDIRLLGAEGDRPFRNQLQARALARECARWIKDRVELSKRRFGRRSCSSTGGWRWRRLIGSRRGCWTCWGSTTSNYLTC